MKRDVIAGFSRSFAIGLAGISAAAHTILGTLDTLIPVMQTDLPIFVRGTMWAAWHMVSAFLILSTYVFWKGGDGARYFAWIYLVAAALFVVTGLRMQGLYGLITLPQWVLLAPGGIAALIAERRLFIRV